MSKVEWANGPTAVYDFGWMLNYIICFTFSVTKLILYLICRRYNTPTLKALTLDSKNDVFSNSVALACGYIGTGIYKNDLPQAVRG